MKLKMEKDLTFEQNLQLNFIIGNSDLEYGKDSKSPKEIERLKRVIKGEISPQDAIYQYLLEEGTDEKIARRSAYGPEKTIE